MKKPSVLGLLFVLLAGLFAVAQETTQPAATTESTAKHISKYVWISIGKKTPGKDKVFSNLVKQIRDTANAENADFYWLAGESLTGDDGEVSFVTFHDSFASVEKVIEISERVMRAASMKNASMSKEETESEGPGHSVLAKYHEELSYRPDLVDLAHMKRWSVTTFQLKPGTSAEFADLAKEYIELVKRTNDPTEHWITYQVLAGMPSPTYLIVTPMKSLADMDQENEEAMKAVFTQPIMRHFGETEQRIVNSVETEYVAVSPGMSRLPQAIVAANPGFWTVKEEGTAVASTKTKKKAPVEPSALKEESKP